MKLYDDGASGQVRYGVTFVGGSSCKEVRYTWRTPHHRPCQKSLDLEGTITVWFLASLAVTIIILS